MRNMNLKLHRIHPIPLRCVMFDGNRIRVLLFLATRFDDQAVDRWLKDAGAGTLTNESVHRGVTNRSNHSIFYKLWCFTTTA
jgi:hypothetical protein